MKTLRELCIAAVFTLSLSCTAFAGEIETTFISYDPSPTTSGWISTTVTGQAGNGGGEGAVGDSAAEAALSLIQGLLSLF
jgi:hypothetical protein